MTLLAENLLLLALDDQRGSVPMAARSHLEPGLAGAMIADLAGLERLDLKHDFWGDRLYVHNPQSTGHALLDKTLAAIAARPGKSVSFWVHQLSRRIGGLRRQLLDQLVAAGTLERRQERYLILFEREMYPERDGHVEKDLRQRLDAVLLENRKPEPALHWLIQLAFVCHVLAGLYDGRQRRVVRKRVKQLAREGKGMAAEAVSQVIQAEQAAIMAVIIASSVAATSAACGSGGGC